MMTLARVKMCGGKNSYCQTDRHFPWEMPRSWPFLIRQIARSNYCRYPIAVGVQLYVGRGDNLMLSSIKVRSDSIVADLFLGKKQNNHPSVCFQFISISRTVEEIIGLGAVVIHSSRTVCLHIIYRGCRSFSYMTYNTSVCNRFRTRSIPYSHMWTQDIVFITHFRVLKWVISLQGIFSDVKAK